MRRAVACVLVGLMVLVAGCPEEKPKGAVVAVVGSDELTKQDLQALAPEGFAVTRENLPRILDKWVSNSLMYQEAVRQGLADAPKTQVYLERLKRDYLVNELLRKLTESVSVSQSEMLDYFNTHRETFAEEVKITRIVLPDSSVAVQTLAEIRQGGDFKRLAEERSLDQLLPGGQESGFLPRGFGDPRGGGDPALEEAIFALRKGEVSEVISTGEGYQIVKIADRRKVRNPPSFAEVQGSIHAILAYRKGEAAVDSVLAELRAAAGIELRPDAYFE